MTMRSRLTSAAALGVVTLGMALAVPAVASGSASPSPASGITKATSPSWAGYAAVARKGKSLRYVAADFDIPGSNCSGQDEPGIGSVASQWIGLGGYPKGPLRQIGVSVLCDGGLVYNAWYLGPNGPVTIIGCNIRAPSCPHGPNAGDRVELSIYFNGKSYRLIYHDVTTHFYRKIYQRCGKCRSRSAEVISQISANTTGPLTVFVVVDFFGVRVTSADGKHGTLAPLARHWTTVKISTVNSSGQTIGWPTALLRHGRAFHAYGEAPGGGS